MIDTPTPDIEAAINGLVFDMNEGPIRRYAAAKDAEIERLQGKIVRARFLVECHGDCNCHNTPVGVCGTCESLEALSDDR